VCSAWSLWFAAFLLIAAGWALVTPVGQYPDEIDHVYVAVSVVRGEVFPHVGEYWDGTGAITNVPLSIRRIVRDDPCRGVGTPSQCSTASAPAGWVTVVTSEGRNFPLYYALVGWPSLLFPDRAGWYLMRLASAVWCAMLLATGALVVMSMQRRPAVLAAGMLAGLTPLALDLSGSINPSGAEAASALCFWAALLALIRGDSALSRPLLVRFGLISGVVLAVCRETGWLWIALAVLASLASVRKAERRVFLRSGDTRLLLAGVAVAASAAQLWSFIFRGYQHFRIPHPPAGLAAVRESLAATPKLLQEILAYLGLLTIPPPAAADVCWVLAAVAVITIGAITERRTGLLVTVGAALVVVLPFAILTYAYLHPQIGIWQGRYTLPLAIGVPLLAVASGRPGHPGHAEPGAYHGAEPTAEPRIVTVLASSAILLVIWAQATVFLNAWAAFGPANGPWYPYPDLGRALLFAGAVVLTAHVAWADFRWSLGLAHGEKRRSARTA
jgi:Predicted membrane protein (DUF2142)